MTSPPERRSGPRGPHPQGRSRNQIKAAEPKIRPEPNACDGHAAGSKNTSDVCPLGLNHGPDVLHIYAEYRPPRRRNHARLLVTSTCPICGGKHTHGAGNDPQQISWGTRVPHCARSDKPGTYCVVPFGGAR